MATALQTNCQLMESFTEIFPRKDKAIHNWDAGLIYLLNSNLQLDTTIGTGLSGNQDLLLSAGFSYSIPN